MNSNNLIETLEKLAGSTHTDAPSLMSIELCLTEINTLHSPACTVDEVVCE